MSDLVTEFAPTTNARTLFPFRRLYCQHVQNRERVTRSRLAWQDLILIIEGSENTNRKSFQRHLADMTSNALKIINNLEGKFGLEPLMKGTRSWHGNSDVCASGLGLRALLPLFIFACEWWNEGSGRVGDFKTRYLAKYRVTHQVVPNGKPQ